MLELYELITVLMAADRPSHRTFVVARAWQQRDSAANTAYFRVAGEFHRAFDYPVRYDDEGHTWIRGHHADDSEAIRAMRCAHVLTVAA